MAPESVARVAALPSIVSIPTRSPLLSTGHLPAQHTPLIGRERELAAVQALLGRDEVRLLTLIGPGGTGKTRLAIRVAEEIAPTFADGVAFVALAGIREPEHMLPAIYQALGGREAGSDFTRERLRWVLEERELLLLLDNVEHLLSQAAAIADLLAASPQLKILVTSRSALRLSGEQEFLVPPLPLPSLAARNSAEETLRSDAVRLFVQRARAVRPGFSPTTDELAAIGAICHRLDGLPLAIELAAARVTHLSPKAMLGRLQMPEAGRLPLLTGGLRDQPERHQTMRDTIAWSYALLDESERAMFQRLSIFVAGFSVAAAAAVCELDELSLLDGIGSLVAKSLLYYEGDGTGEPRYRMFETIREFALEQLAVSGEDTAARQRHAEWALELAERAGPRVRGPDAPLWLDALERDHAGLRAALTWLAEQRNGPWLARLAGALWPFWEEHAHFAEGRSWLEAALDLAAAAPARARLQVLSGAGTMARHHADFAHGIVRHQQALELAREIGDREEEATILHYLGAQSTDLGNFSQSRAYLSACIAIAQEIGAPWPLIRARHGLAQIQRVELDSAAALRNLEEVLALVLTHQMRWLQPYLRTGIALAATDLGDYDRASQVFRESLTESLTNGQHGHVIDALEGTGRLAAMMGQPEPAARLYAVGEALREKLTFPLSPTEIAEAAPVMERLRAALGDDGFAAAQAAGRALSQDDAVAEAFAILDEPQNLRPPTSDLRPVGLTERELEVLRLLATGHSNRELADLLFISPTTAARHVANIYGKLGVGSRAEAITYAHQHGLV